MSVQPKARYSRTHQVRSGVRAKLSSSHSQLHDEAKSRPWQPADSLPLMALEARLKQISLGAQLSLAAQ